MKNKILKILGNPMKVITAAIILSILIGFYIYKTNVHPTVADVSNLNVSMAGITGSGQATSTDNFTNGENIGLAFQKGGRVNKVNVKAGDIVVKGQVLAELDSADSKGIVTQAEGALGIAQANYEKILNGATGNDIDIAKTALQTAQTNLDQTTKQQSVLAVNAKRNLLNSSFIPTLDPTNYPMNSIASQIAPVISGTYSKDVEGQIIIKTYFSNGGVSFELSGLASGTGMLKPTIPQPLGDTGLFVTFSDTNSPNIWILNIPDKQKPQYVQNLNTYQSALSTQQQAVANASSLLDQAKAALVAKQASARPEDVAIAKSQVDSASGVLETAQAVYDNNIIKAPTDGTIVSVNVNEGEIAIINQKAIEMTVLKK